MTATPTTSQPPRWPPCLLLTRNYRHFAVLGVRTHTQAVDGVMAVVAINIGEMQVQAAVMLPAAPVRAAGAAVKWASDRIGPVTWVILAVVIGGGIYWYHKQPPGRRDRIKQLAGEIGTHLLAEVATAFVIAADLDERPVVRARDYPDARERLPRFGDQLCCGAVKFQQVTKESPPPERCGLSGLVIS